MSLETLFSLANLTALAGWAVLLLSPVLPRAMRLLPRLAIPALLALAYLVLVLTSFGGATGDFSTLAGVASLFRTPEVLLAGWLHFLAFDLLVGAWIVEDRERTGVPFLLVVPCLVLCFLLGPAGFLLYLVLATGFRRAAPIGKLPR